MSLQVPIRTAFQLKDPVRDFFNWIQDHQNEKPPHPMDKGTRKKEAQQHLKEESPGRNRLQRQLETKEEALLRLVPDKKEALQEILNVRPVLPKEILGKVVQEAQAPLEEDLIVEEVVDLQLRQVLEGEPLQEVKKIIFL